MSTCTECAKLGREYSKNGTVHQPAAPACCCRRAARPAAAAARLSSCRRHASLWSRSCCTARCSAARSLPSPAIKAACCAALPSAALSFRPGRAAVKGAGWVCRCASCCRCCSSMAVCRARMMQPMAHTAAGPLSARTARTAPSSRLSSQLISASPGEATTRAACTALERARAGRFECCCRCGCCCCCCCAACLAVGLGQVLQARCAGREGMVKNRCNLLFKGGACTLPPRRCCLTQSRPVPDPGRQQCAAHLWLPSLLSDAVRCGLCEPPLWDAPSPIPTRRLGERRCRASTGSCLPTGTPADSEGAREWRFACCGPRLVAGGRQGSVGRVRK